MPETRRRHHSYLDRLVKSLLLSLAIHLVVLTTLALLRPADDVVPARRRPNTVAVIVREKDEARARPRPAEPEAAPEEEEDESDAWDGQIVEIAPPEDQTPPDEADYLAEYNSKVEEETRSEKFRINPEVLAPTYSRKDSYKLQDLMDLGADQPSTGAKTGTGSPLPPEDGRLARADVPSMLTVEDGVEMKLPKPSKPTFDPARDGRLASLPSPFLITNKDGLDRPVPASHAQQDLSGAPGNDLLDEKVGPGVNLNAIEVKFAPYINLIKRMVNFYWSQNLDNLPDAVRMRLMSPSYKTVVYVVLDRHGVLQSIEVVSRSGEDALDDAVVQAFRIAGPFPDPPEQLIARDGRAYLNGVSFTVESGGASAPYVGVDPRSGVQFPGILKATR